MTSQINKFNLHYDSKGKYVDVLSQPILADPGKATAQQKAARKADLIRMVKQDIPPLADRTGKYWVYDKQTNQFLRATNSKKVSEGQILIFPDTQSAALGVPYQKKQVKQSEQGKKQSRPRKVKQVQQRKKQPRQRQARRQPPKRNKQRQQVQVQVDYLGVLQKRLDNLSRHNKLKQNMNLKIRQVFSQVLAQPALMYLHSRVLCDGILRIGFRYTSDIRLYQRAYREYLSHTVDGVYKVFVDGYVLKLNLARDTILDVAQQIRFKKPQKRMIEQREQR